VRALERNDILKAMITQNIGEDLSYYESILNDIEENMNYPDIFSETVSKIFRLVLTGRLDPWSVNISEFKDLFAKERRENFEVAGILISSAWHVLYEKSVMMMHRAIDDELEYPDSEEYQDSNMGVFESDDTTIGTMPDLKIPVFHRESSKVTLTEFLIAMKRVYKLREKKNEDSEEYDYTADIDEDIIAKSNTDTIDQGIEETMHRIAHYMNPFFVEDYWGNTKIERTSFILYLLFLEKSGKISLNQEEPFGNIQVTKLF
jgi:segregation and condensation protein A